MKESIIKSLLRPLGEDLRRYLYLFLLLLEKSITYFLIPKKKTNSYQKQNIIIIGTIETNKGNQAMIYTAMDQLRIRFPNYPLYLFINTDYDKKIIEQENYNAIIMPWNLDIRNRVSCYWYNYLMRNDKYSNLVAQLKLILQNSKFIVDVNGYRLSSMIEPDTWITCILDLIIARKYNIPYMMCPHTIGPFNFNPFVKACFFKLAKLYIKHPKRIYTRGKTGIKYVQQIREGHVNPIPDIVLQNRTYNLAHIFKSIPNFKSFDIKKDSVALIPNFRVLNKAYLNDIYEIYDILLKKLLECQKNVYIFYHSSEDTEIGKKIFSQFKEEKFLHLIAQNLNAVELETLLSKFDFIIASRFHSIVHGYKSGIPALVIGWSIKYNELLNYFNQLEYYFDIRKPIDINKLISQLEKMLNNHNQEKQVISKKMEMIFEKANWFDFIVQDLQE